MWSTSHALPDFVWIDKNEDSIDVQLWSGGVWLCLVQWLQKEGGKMQLQEVFPKETQGATVKGPVDF